MVQAGSLEAARARRISQNGAVPRRDRSANSHVSDYSQLQAFESAHARLERVFRFAWLGHLRAECDADEH